MRPEDVPEEWVWAFEDARYPKDATAKQRLRWQLAAVAPLIAAAEREACARVAQQTGYELENLDERNGAFAAVAAIRARGTTP
jgi:hypothetical protein